MNVELNIWLDSKDSEALNMTFFSIPGIGTAGCMLPHTVLHGC